MQLRALGTEPCSWCCPAFGPHLFCVPPFCWLTQPLRLLLAPHLSGCALCWACCTASACAPRTFCCFHPAPTTAGGGGPSLPPPPLPLSLSCTCTLSTCTRAAGARLYHSPRARPQPTFLLPPCMIPSCWGLCMHPPCAPLHPRFSPEGLGCAARPSFPSTLLWLPRQSPFCTASLHPIESLLVASAIPTACLDIL
jgi:hypothetical protein